MTMDTASNGDLCPDCEFSYPDLAAHEPECIDRARRMVAEDQAQQEHACLEEVHAVLEKYGMQLSVSPGSIVLGPKGS